MKALSPREEVNVKGPKGVATSTKKPEKVKSRRKKGGKETTGSPQPVGAPELPPEVVKACLKKHICINYQKGTCPWKNCKYEHEIVAADPPEERKTVDAGMVQVNMADASRNKPFLVDKILIDGGSNEIIRPNYSDLWKEIMAGKKGNQEGGHEVGWWTY